MVVQLLSICESYTYMEVFWNNRHECYINVNTCATLDAQKLSPWVSILYTSFKLTLRTVDVKRLKAIIEWKLSRYYKQLEKLNKYFLRFEKLFHIE